MGRRADRKEADGGANEEEVLVSTADDGTIKVYLSPVSK